MIQFQFPEQQQKFLQIDSHHQLKQLLRQNAKSVGFKTQIFMISYSKQKYIYARCRQCSCSIRYKAIDNQKFKCIYWKTSHNHKIKKTLTTAIQNYIKSLPSKLTINSIKHLVKSTFLINDSQFYYIHKKIEIKTKSFQKLIDDLNFRNFDNRHVPFPLKNDLPDVFLTIAPNWKQNFKKYPENLTFDLTYGLIKQKRIRQKPNGDTFLQNYGVGLFLGKNNQNKTIPFGLVIMNRQTNEDFYNVFKEFFQIMENDTCTVLSDQQITIKSSLQKLKSQGKWRGEHLFDNMHVLRNLKKKVKNQYLYRELYSALMTEDEQMFDQYIIRAKDEISNEDEDVIVKNFLQRAKHTCYSQVPPCFIGLASISTAYHQKANDTLKSYIHQEKPAILAIEKIIKILDQFGQQSNNHQYEKNLFNDLIDDYDLKKMQYKVCKKVFKVYAKRYFQSFQISFSQQRLQKIKCFRQGKQQRYFLIAEQKIYKCGCLLNEKSGIPCMHQIRLCKLKKLQILDYFYERWIINPQIKQKNELVLPLGRPKLSRR